MSMNPLESEYAASGQQDRFNKSIDSDVARNRREAIDLYESERVTLKEAAHQAKQILLRREIDRKEKVHELLDLTAEVIPSDDASRIEMTIASTIGGAAFGAIIAHYGGDASIVLPSLISAAGGAARTFGLEAWDEAHEQRARQSQTDEPEEALEEVAQNQNESTI